MGGSESLNCRAKACGATEERRSWGAGGCVHPSSATTLPATFTGEICLRAGDRACVLWGAWWGSFTMGHQAGVRDGLQGHAFSAWSMVTFPFPTSLWKLQCGDVVTARSLS